MPALYASTLLVSAFLLFCVQPMVARALLPLCGGSSSVWITCMVFFQATLLAGYAYAHGAIRLLGPRRQALLHLALLPLPLLFLPLAIGEADVARWPVGENPVLRVIGLLALRIGVPFFVLSASAPMLQRWFSSTRHPGAGDPYWLYTASNLGSLLALLGYPFLIEPLLGLGQQAALWRGGYLGLAALVAASVALLWRWEPLVTAEQGADEALTWERRARWVALAAIPSSLLSGVTTYLTTDIASVPLLWVLPLGLYLLSFTLAFATRPLLRQETLSRMLPLPVAIVSLLLLAEAVGPLWVFLPANLLMFFLAAWVAHGALAQDRPGPSRLTEFFLLVSLGGVIGGAFNALVAPLVFRGIAEYPLALVAALLCRTRLPDEDRSSRSRLIDLLHPIGIGTLTGALALLVQRFRVEPVNLVPALVFLPPTLLNYRQIMRPTRFAFGLGAIFLGSYFYVGVLGRVELRERSFYGPLRVTIDREEKFRQIAHGNTIHGSESLDPIQRRTPAGYYHRTGPLGQLFAEHDRSPAAPAVAVVGLGAGAMAPYARPGERWTYFEIDPLVVRVARDPRYFHYLEDAFPRGDNLDILVGDARLRLRERPDHSFGLILLDAFSSDAIPIHLIVREAMAVYLQKLAPGGIIGFHVSNRFLELRPIVAALGQDAGASVRCREDTIISESLAADGKLPSIWCAIVPPGRPLGALGADPWLAPAAGPLWTDDRSNLLGAVMLRAD
jgi:spermidine synthase